MNQSLHLLTDDNSIDINHYWPTIIEAVEAGIDVFQLRFKHQDKKAFFEIAKTIRPYMKDHGVTFLINDHVDIALMVDADGVHLGQSDLPADEARKLLGPSKIIGLSLSSLEEFNKCQQAPVDYFGVGPIFPTQTKSKPAMGLAQLQHICQTSPIPSIAIGGITDQNAEKTLKAGAKGIAVCGFITQAASAFHATQTLKAVL